MLLVHEKAEIGFEPLIRSFGLSIGARVVCRGNVLFNVQYSTHLLHELGRESGVAVADNLPRQSETSEYVRHEDVCYSFRRDLLFAGDEYRCFCTVVVSDGEDGVIVLRLREFRDEVHRDYFKWLCIRLRKYWGEWQLRWLGVYFVSLTVGASFDVCQYVVFQPRPPVLSLY